MSKLALIDIDGTLANDEHRIQFALKRMWADYFRPDRMAKDTLLAEGKELVDDLVADGWDIAYLTGRRADRTVITENWLSMYGFPSAWKILCRDFSDLKPLANFKVGVIKNILALDVYDDVVLFDDDPEVVRLVKKNFGENAAVHCTWYIKNPSMVKAAKG